MSKLPLFGKRVSELCQGGLRDLRQRPARNVPGLDVLRCCAILLVVVGHGAGAFIAPPWFSASPFGRWGWTGVDLFFVLSGLLIGTQLWRELDRTGGIRVGRFLLRRGLRIWPLYTSLVVLLFGEVVLFGRNRSGLWVDAAYLSNYFHSQIAGSWSLSTEEQFYILAPLSLVAISKILKPGKMWIIPAAALAALNLIRMYAVGHSTLPEDQLRVVLFSPIHTHADGLAVGLLLGWMAVMHPGWIASITTRCSIAAVALGAGVLLYRYAQVVTNFAVLGLIYGSVTLLIMAPKRLPGIFNWHGFYVMSRLSYGMYLNHFGVLEHLSSYLGGWQKASGGLAFWVCQAISLVLSIGLACVTFLLIEWPFLRLRDQWLAKNRTVTPTTMASHA
jgi:peptidoglycan/LPS O-acetylase OafA/YrhL